MSEETMQAFHSKEYIDFLKNVTPENQVQGKGRHMSESHGLMQEMR